MVLTESSDKSPDDTRKKYAPLWFHRVHGSGIVLTDGNTVATRTSDFCNGIVFSETPVRNGQKVCIELTQTSEWSGAIRIGVTLHDPGKMSAVELPRYVCPYLTSSEGYWARSLKETYAETGNRVTFYINSSGQMHYFVNNEHKGILLGNLPKNKPLWLLFDLYGNTSSAKFVPPDEAPVEILARGPDALRAYHRGCESGTKPVFRTRLMLVGQDGVGKTSLKKALTGQRHDAAEESTEGIDLSASCSFNLRDRAIWKLAIRGDPPQQIADPDRQQHVIGGIESLEEEYHQAIASNIVQELLYRKKQKEKEAEKEKDKETAGNGEKKKRISGFVRLLSKEKKNKSNCSTDSGSLANDDLKGHALLQEMPDRVIQLVEEKMKEKEDGKLLNDSPANDGSRNGRNINLSIWDFAGRAIYYTTHQVFLSSRAVYIIVFNLSQELDDLARVKRPGAYQEEWVTSELSSLDYMDLWMNSIHAHASQNTRNSVDNTTLSPPIFLVGTHRNTLNDDPQVQHKIVEEKFDRIRDMVKGKAYQKHIVNHFYAVENSFSDVEDDELVKLRCHIEEAASKEPYMGEQMPIKWLRFEQSLAQLVKDGTNFSSYDQITEVAKEAGIAAGELKTVLEFYHDFGDIVYYGGSAALDNVLRNTVILKPQWLVDMFKRIITAREFDQQWGAYKELWQRLDRTGILEERLVDYIWRDVLDQKPALLGLMQKFELLAERLPPKNLVSQTVETLPGCRSFYVPSRLQNGSASVKLFTATKLDVVFYLDFFGFLPDGLFHRVLTRAIQWSSDCGGHEPQVYYRKARFFLDPEHDFALEMAPLKLARIKVTVLRVVDLSDSDENSSDSSADKLMPSPRPAACAKVRNFLESTLSDLRELWMKRISYRACVPCYCDKVCSLHNKARCPENSCIHFLHLDECISNKIVCCEHRRVKTTPYRKWFPSPIPVVKQGPVLPASLVMTAEETYGNIEATKGSQLPGWVKSAAKLLDGGAEGQDWLAMAKRMGYKKGKINKFTDDLNPALALLTDWIISSGNTALSVDMIVTYAEQMQRDDIIDVIQKGQELEVEPPQAFISYQWDSQDEVKPLRDRLEKAGFSCWMDIGQMGGGDQLYTRIDHGIRNAKLVIACLTPKYVVSHHCNKEIGLADLLRKPIVPVMLEKVPWPPPGGMSLMFSQLCYINMKGVGGHGGSGIHADLENKYQEIIQRVSFFTTSQNASTLDWSTMDHSQNKISEPSYISEESMTAQPENSHDAVILPGYLSDYSARTHLPGYGQLARRRQVSVSANRAPTPVRSPTPQVEQVHVTKCAVCVIL